MLQYFHMNLLMFYHLENICSNDELIQNACGELTSEVFSDHRVTLTIAEKIIYVF